MSNMKSKTLDKLCALVVMIVAVYIAAMVSFSPAPLWLIIPVDIICISVFLWSLDGLLVLYGIGTDAERRDE